MKPIEGEGIKPNVKPDNVNHPSHYTSHPSGVECIEITRHYCFSIGNAIKYLWRAGLKKEQGLEDRQKEIEDLEKAIWYINDRIKQLKMEDKCEILAPGVEFYPKDGTILMIRCPECGKENWAPQVASGICSWCGFDGRELLKKKEDGN